MAVAHPHSAPTPGVQVPIVPMLDVTFQLLAFFILTYHPSTLTEGAIEFTLPAERSTAGPTISPPPTGDDFLPPLSVVVEGFHDEANAGQIRSLRIDALTESTTVANLPALEALLRRTRPAGGPAPVVQVRVESNVAYGKVFDVVGACVAAGYERVGLGTPPDGEDSR